MGDLFEPDVTQEPTTSGYQQQVQALIAQQFPGLFRGVRSLLPQRKAALSEILQGTPTDVSAIEHAMLRRFDREIAPRIGASFANVGGTLSSRRGETTAQALGDVGAQIGALQTQLIEGARNRQLAASQQVLSERLAPFGVGGSFSTAGTMDTLVQPSIGSQLLGVGGQLGSSYLLGK
jgi:hypothetical protein